MTPDRATLLAWYRDSFIPDPDRGYALMNPVQSQDKYVRASRALSGELIGGGLDGRTTRRKSLGGLIVPQSIAVVPMHRDGWAVHAALDVDAGGAVAMQQALDVCQRVGLWAFAQIGNGEAHSGGHLYIPSDSRQPAPLLQSLARRIQAAAGVSGEAYPFNQDLRLPLMLHLRAPGGPRRFPLLFQGGEITDATDPWQALGILRERWHANSAEAITAALDTLPGPSVARPAKRHKSKVNTENTASVISWYLSNYELRDLLADRGVVGADRRNVVCCPWHDDKHPSLAIFEHPDGHDVCRCFSQNSSCPAAGVPYLDAFNLYAWNTTPGEAVKELAAAHGLGEQRSLRIEAMPERDQPTKRTPGEHQALILAGRERLTEELHHASTRAGEVTIVRATMGLGKTHAAALLANERYTAGDSVAIVAPSHELAESEWAPRLTRAFIWRSRLDLCTCYDRAYLESLAGLGYALPDCEPECPYIKQYDQRRGIITIYQHNHLHLNGGKLLAGYDVVIIDESPIGALLEEERRGPDDLRRLLNRAVPDVSEPAKPLLRALADVGRAVPPSRSSLRGEPLLQALRQALPLPLDEAIQAAKTSTLAHEHLPADGITPAEHLPPLFLGRLIRALEHDSQPDTPNTLLAWDGLAWSWFRPHPLLAHSAGKLTAPAVIVLDGSADPVIAQRLYQPWPVRIVSIDVPLAPSVTVVQCPVTTSTRRLVQDRETLDSAIRAVMTVCDTLGVLVDGGISYLKAEQHLAGELGGQWLHYGGQRGNNTLKDARTLAILASPTAPPDAIERKALALWADDPAPIVCRWECVGKGDYQTADPRLDAVSRLHGPEELRQAAHRCRPILSTESTLLLVFSPWDLASLGLAPHHLVTQLPYGNSSAVKQAAQRYRDALHRIGTFQSPLSNSVLIPKIEKRQFDTQPAHMPPLSAPPARGPSKGELEKPRNDAPYRPPLIAADDPWIVLQRQLEHDARAVGDFERAAFYQRILDRVGGHHHASIGGRNV